MEQHLAQDINEKDRWQFLCDNADAVEKSDIPTDSRPKNWRRRKNRWPKYRYKSTTSRRRKKK